MESNDAVALHMESIKQFLASLDPLLLILGENRKHEKEFVETIINRHRAEYHIIHMTSHTDTTPSDIIELLTKHWAEITPQPNAKLETQIQTLLEALSATRKPCLFVLDSADQLPLNTLAALSHIVMQQDTMFTNLHIILSGNTALDDSLNNLIAIEPMHIILDAMSESKANIFMQNYFDKKHVDVNNTAMQQVMHRIYNKSYGLPKKMVSMLHKISAEHLTAPNEKKWHDNLPILAIPNLIKKNTTRAISLSALVAIGFYLTWHQHHTTPFNSTQLPIGDHFTVAAAPETSKQNTINLSDINTENVEAQIQMQIDESKQLAPKTKTYVAHNTIITPTPKNTTTRLASNKPINVTIKKPIAKKSPTIHVAKKKPAQPVTHKTLSTFYTLQIMSTSNKRALNKYKNTHHLNAALIKTKYKGKAWFLLGYGHFKSHQEANQALKQAPSNIKKFHPWIRAIKQT